MQLLVLVLFIMMIGKNRDIEELKPVIEEMGGEAQEALKEAEELSSVVAAVQAVAHFAEPRHNGKAGGECADNPSYGTDNVEYVDKPLAPIASIANGEILTALSCCIPSPD